MLFHVFSLKNLIFHRKTNNFFDVLVFFIVFHVLSLKKLDFFIEKLIMSLIF